MMTPNDVSMIRKEAQAICDPYKIQVAEIDELPAAIGGGFAINILLPRSLGLDTPEVTDARLRLEKIKGVQRVHIVLSRR